MARMGILYYTILYYTILYYIVLLETILFIKHNKENAKKNKKRTVSYAGTSHKVGWYNDIVLL